MVRRYTPAPQCFGIGACLFAIGLALAVSLRCKHLLPACPVTAIVPMGPIGVCRVQYTYEVDSVTYADSLEISECANDGGSNHTLSVCYDDLNPARHDAAIDVHQLNPNAYVGMLWLMSFGIALISMSACVACTIWNNAEPDAHPHEYASVTPMVPIAPMVPMQALPVSSFLAAPTPTPPKLQRSDSAMMMEAGGR